MNHQEKQKRPTDISPARIGVGRAGARPRTETLLEFRQDHALARDAVWSELSQEIIEKLNFPFFQSTSSSKEEFLLNPDSGRAISAETRDCLVNQCPLRCDVQIVIADGLSSPAVQRNVQNLLLSLLQGLEMKGLSVGTPVIMRYGRVAVGDAIASALQAKMVIMLIGERPGLRTPSSLSAYMTYNPNPKTVDADRTVVSNIHSRGTPPFEAGAYIAELAEKILDHQASGLGLEL